MRPVGLIVVFLVTLGGGAIPARATGARAPVRDLPRYELQMRVVPDAHRLEAKGTVRLPAEAAARDTLGLVLSRQMRDLCIEVVAPAASAGPAELSAAPKGRSTRWTVRLPRPLPAGEPAVLRFSYAGGEELDTMFYVGPEVSFATAYGTDWYPLADAADDLATGTLRLSVPPGMVALAEGLRRSTPGEEAQGVFRFESIHPTYFSFAAGPFRVVRSSGKVPIALYLLSERGEMRPFATGIARIVDVLSREFGPFPFGELALVEVPRDLAQRARFNAATVKGFVYVNHRAFDVPDVAMLYEWLGHEISHSWFPNCVALRTPPGLYMEEALAQYGGLRVVETLAGPDAAERLRRTGYAPDPIYSAAAYFRLVGRGVDRELERLEPSAEGRDLAYTKGALVWDMLSREIGRERFWRALGRITRTHAFGRLTWAAFLRQLEVGTGRRLDWFYRQWFGRTGAPEFRLSWTQTGSVLHCSITQQAPFYEATIEISANGGAAGVVTRRIRVRGSSTSVTLRIPFAVQSVTLDPQYKVLRWTPEYHALAREAASPK